MLDLAENPDTDIAERPAVMIRMHDSPANLLMQEFLRTKLGSSSDFASATTEDVPPVRLSIRVPEFNTVVPVPALKRLTAHEQELRELFQGIDADELEDGMNADFIESFQTYIRRYGVLGVNAFAKTLRAESVPADRIVGRAARWLGRTDDSASLEQRRLLLEELLMHDSIAIRDGALLGLVALGDSRSIESIKRQMEMERAKPLKKQMEKAIARLGG
jgi:hypothetical protein